MHGLRIALLAPRLQFLAPDGHRLRRREANPNLTAPHTHDLDLDLVTEVNRLGRPALKIPHRCLYLLLPQATSSLAME